VSTVTPAQEYIRQQFLDMALTYAHMEALVRYYQACQPKLIVDGKPGKKTLHELELSYPNLFPPKNPGKFLHHPLPILPGSRKPVITSGFRTKDRKDHDGVDMFYAYRIGDQPSWVGDGGCEGKNADGTPKWCVPFGTEVLAAADGVVMMAGPSETGVRCWINHHNGLRSGYFHLEKLYFASGVTVKKHQPIGTVGHSPRGTDGRHLHFEVSPIEKYAPVDPTKHLVEW
jgi:hypothetical protein